MYRTKTHLIHVFHCYPVFSLYYYIGMFLRRSQSSITSLAQAIGPSSVAGLSAVGAPAVAVEVEEIVPDAIAIAHEGFSVKNEQWIG